MAESLGFDPTQLPKEAKYEAVKALLDGLKPEDTTQFWAALSFLANVTAVLKEAFGWWWIGFYLDTGNDLALGPFQGPLACTTIAYERGVCGAAYTQKQTQLVADVHLFPGHIACSAASLSEIVVPIMLDNRCLGVLDADSEHLAYFDTTDAKGLEAIVQIVAPYLNTVLHR